jgi:hypothetical protein
VLLTVFRKTRQHDPRQIDRAVRAQKTCERDHRVPAVEIYERRSLDFRHCIPLPCHLHDAHSCR